MVYFIAGLVAGVFAGVLFHAWLNAEVLSLGRTAKAELDKIENNLHL